MKAKEKELMRREVMGESLDDQKPERRRPKKTLRKKTKPKFRKRSGDTPEEEIDRRHLLPGLSRRGTELDD